MTSHPSRQNPSFSSQREEAAQLARKAVQQLYGTLPEAGSSLLPLLTDALERAAQSEAFAELSPLRKLEAAVDLLHSQSRLDRLRGMVDSLMSNPGTLGRQLVARATRGEDLLGMALEAHLPFRVVSSVQGQAITA